MRKILLVMEDYSEMVFVETILKKLGFDCIGAQNETGLADKILGFTPHLVIADAFGKKVGGLQLGQKIKKIKGYPKLMLVLTPPQRVDQDDMQRLNVDSTINRPIHPADLLKSIGQVLDLDTQLLKKKMEKMGLFQEETKEGMQIVSGAVAVPKQELQHLKETTRPETQRVASYEKYLNELPEPSIDGLNRKNVVEQVKEFRSRENDPEIKEIDEERMAFAKALFRTGKNK